MMPRSQQPIPAVTRRKPRHLAPPLLALVAAITLFPGCGGSGDSTTSAATATTTTTTTGPLEAKLQADIDNATADCRDAAAQISDQILSNAANAACDQIDADLTNALASSIAEAKGNAQAALENLAADCRSKAAQLDGGQGVVGHFCDGIAAAAQGQ